MKSEGCRQCYFVFVFRFFDTFGTIRVAASMQDKAADILAREAVGLWAARQSEDVTWPSASLCGVGAALDYTAPWS